MSRLWSYRLLLVPVALSISFSGSSAQQWCSDTGYIEDRSRCLDNGGQYVSTFHCLFELDEEEEEGYIVFNVSQPNCNISEVVTTFALDGGNYIEYNETKDAIVVSNRIDVDVPRNGGVWEFIEGSIGCLGAQPSQVFCFTIKLININDNLPNITLDEEEVEVKELAIQFDSCVITTLTIVDVDLGFEISKLYEIAEKDVPFGLMLTKDLECTSELTSPGCQIGYAGNEDETKYSLIVTDPSEIDYETAPNYTLTIRAWEGDGCPSEFNPTRNDTAVIIVYVTDADDLPPEFESAMYRADVREAEVNVSLSVTPEIKAEDGDTLGADIEYSLVCDDLNSDCLKKLEINKTSAVITVIDEFIYEDQEYTVEVQATQVNNPQQSSRVPLVITILPDNTECPTFEQDRYDGLYVNGDDYVLNEDRETLEIKLTDKDLMFEGSITVPSESPYNVTNVPMDSQSVTLRLTPRERPITDNATVEILVSDDYVGCEKRTSVFIQLTNSDFFFEHQTIGAHGAIISLIPFTFYWMKDNGIDLRSPDPRVYVDEGDTEVAFDPPSLKPGECADYEFSKGFEGNFTINNDGGKPKIVKATPFDYETNVMYGVSVTALKGNLDISNDDCMTTDTNDTAFITIMVVDLNDETPVFKIANTNGILFEAVFFDVMGNEKIFTLADRVYDADVTASLTFSLTSPELSPLFSRTDGTVLTNSNFNFIGNVSKTYDYITNVTDLKTEKNDDSSSCPLKFGIMGWDQIFMYEGFYDDQSTSRTKRSDLQTLAVTEEEAIEICEEEGKVGWSLDESNLIKLDRIFKDGDRYYIWLYGVDVIVPKYLTNSDVESGDIVRLLETNCPFFDVNKTDTTSFYPIPISDYVFVFIAGILFIGIIIMIIFLFYSWNKFLEEKGRYQDFHRVPESIKEEREKTPEPEPVPEPEPEPELEIVEVDPVPIPVIAHMEPVQREPERVHEYEWQEAIMDMQSVDSFSMITLGPEANPGDKEDSSSVSTATTDGDTEPLIPYATFAHINVKQPEAPRNEIPKTDYTESKGTESVVKVNSAPKEEIDPSHKEVMLNRTESTTDPRNKELEHPEDENDRSIRNDKEADHDGQDSNAGIKYADIATDAVGESEQGSGVANEAFESSPPPSPTLSPKVSPPPPPPPPPPPVSPKPTQERDVDPMQDPDDNYQWVEKPQGNALPDVDIV